MSRFSSLVLAGFLAASASLASISHAAPAVPGTLFFQVSASIAAPQSRGIESVPGANFPSEILRSSPANGPQLLGFACYGVTYDPNTARMCFMRARKITNAATGQPFEQSVFYTANPDGSNVRLLYRERLNYGTDAIADFTPSYLSDGQIAFETGDRIALMNGDGGNVRFLTREGEKVGLPVGARGVLAFEKNGVALMDAGGGTRRKLVSFPTLVGSGEDYADASLSSDARQLAYTRRVNGRKQIFVVASDRAVGPNNRPRQVSNRDARFQFADYSDPVWSPNGRFLAVAAGTETSHDLFLIDLSTGKMTRLTQTPYDELPCDWDLTPPMAMPARPIPARATSSPATRSPAMSSSVITVPAPSASDVPEAPDAPPGSAPSLPEPATPEVLPAPSPLGDATP